MKNINQINNKTFVGFGLGAVQAGLMLNEAIKSGNFNRFVVIEVNRQLIDLIRKNNSSLMLNTATADGIIKSRLSDIEIYDPLDPHDRQAIAEAIREADEMATAIPSIDFYKVNGDNSIAAYLAKNINRTKPQILYAAENNNYAAEILLDVIKDQVDGEDELKQFQVLNTVIGKMGGLISERDVIETLDLNPIVEGYNHAFLVEEFNHIIISKILLKNYKRGIEVFEEKTDLLPFEEAKLFGHNTVHSLLGYLAYFKGYTYMSQIRDDSALYEIGQESFSDECGATLIKKYNNLNEELFSEEGFYHYGSDLLIRMTNPYLKDKVSRICRDPKRKIGYNDRFFGAMREALNQNVNPVRMAQGALCALLYVIKEKVNIGIDLPKSIKDIDRNEIRNILKKVWGNEPDDSYQGLCLDLVEEVHTPLMKLII